jgi:DNA-binding ferritin-like protein (Dps family)
MSNFWTKLTGETDVAAFCDERLRGVPSYSYVDNGRASLNRDVAKQLGLAGRQG